MNQQMNIYQGNVKGCRNILIDLHSTSIVRSLAVGNAAVVVADVGGLLEPIKTLWTFFGSVKLVDYNHGVDCGKIFCIEKFLGI